MKTILQINESDFRKAGKHGDSLICTIRECEELIQDNVMNIKTDLMFDLQHPEIIAFNHYLRRLRSQNIIMVQVKLD